MLLMPLRLFVQLDPDTTVAVFAEVADDGPSAEPVEGDFDTKMLE